jgi:predicted amidophosphoribosyltransferase
MTPVDLILPLPETICVSQQRGFWFSLELAKKLSQLTKTPYNKDLLHLNNKSSLPLRETLSDMFTLNHDIAKSILVHRKRVAIVMPYMISEFILNDLAKNLKAHGSLWVSYWVLTRKLKKDSY